MNLLLIIIVISSLQFTPFIWESGYYGLLKNIVLFFLFLMFARIIFSNRHIVRNCQITNFRIFIISLILVVLSSLFLVGIGCYVRFSPLYELLLSIIFLFVGINCEISNRQLNILVVTYIHCVIFLGVYVILFYSNGFYISDTYLPIPKNQLGPFLAIASLSALYISGLQKEKKYIVYFIALSLFLFFIVLILRARANVVAVLLGYVVYLFFYIKRIRYIIVFIVFCIIIGIITNLPQLLYDSFFSNYDVDSLDSVSSGRVDVYKVGLDFLGANFFRGEIFSGAFMTDFTIHNYVLHKLVAFGAIFSLPYIYVYMYLLVIVLKGIKKGVMTISNIGCFIFIVPFVVSLFEYTYPFGPGMPMLFPFICFGYYLKNKKI